MARWYAFEEAHSAVYRRFVQADTLEEAKELVRMNGVSVDGVTSEYDLGTDIEIHVSTGKYIDPDEAEAEGLNDSH